MAKADIKISPEDRKSSRRRLAHLVAEFGSISQIPDELLIGKGINDKNEPCVVLRDGAKVTDADLKAAYDAAIKDPNIAEELAEIQNARSKKTDGKADDKKSK